MSIKDALLSIKGNDLKVENQPMSSNSHNFLRNRKFSNSGGQSSRVGESISGNRSPRIIERKESSDSEGEKFNKESTYQEHCKSLQKVKRKQVTKSSKS
jgi:hypothetical protein